MVAEGEGSGYEPSLLLEGSLGKLACYLRMFGLNAQWVNLDPISLARKGLEEGRWIVTRRVGYPWEVFSGIRVIRVKEDFPERQVVNVLRELPCRVDPSRWFTRCLRCNEVLQEVAGATVLGAVPDYVALCYNTFRRCPKCRRVYWPGTHREHMLFRMRAWAGEAWGTKEPARHEQKT